MTALTAMSRLMSVAALAAFLGFAGCASHHEEGVTSDYRTQWTSVAADTKATTEAARAVLEQRQLKNVSASSTAVDGVAKAKMADGTQVMVNIKKENDASSQVSVTVGTLGDPKLGADIAKQVKMMAEGK